MPWHSCPTLTGRFVRLEPLAEQHAPGLLAAAHPDLFRFTPQAPPEWSVDGFLHDIARLNGFADTVALAVIDLATGAVIGRSTFMDIHPQNRTLEIGRTWISLSQQGTNANPEMKLLMMQHAFETLGAIRVAFKTSLENEHSQRAIAKLGALREGVLRKDRILPDGRTRDTVVFSVIDSEWPIVKRGLQVRLGLA